MKRIFLPITVLVIALTFLLLIGCNTNTMPTTDNYYYDFDIDGQTYSHTLTKIYDPNTESTNYSITANNNVNINIEEVNQDGNTWIAKQSDNDGTLQLTLQLDGDKFSYTAISHTPTDPLSANDDTLSNMIFGFEHYDLQATLTNEQFSSMEILGAKLTLNTDGTAVLNNGQLSYKYIPYTYYDIALFQDDGTAGLVKFDRTNNVWEPTGTLHGQKSLDVNLSIPTSMYYTNISTPEKTYTPVCIASASQLLTFETHNQEKYAQAIIYSRTEDSIVPDVFWGKYTTNGDNITISYDTDKDITLSTTPSSNDNGVYQDAIFDLEHTLTSCDKGWIKVYTPDTINSIGTVDKTCDVYIFNFGGTDEVNDFGDLKVWDKCSQEGDIVVLHDTISGTYLRLDTANFAVLAVSDNIGFQS